MAVESDKGMVSMFVDYYLEGMIVGTAIMLALGGLCLIVCLKEKNRKHCTPSPDYWKPGKTGNMAKKALTEATFYIGASLILITVLYAWITPIASYSGVVEDRYTRQNFRKWPRTNHYLVVNGIRRWVDENIYDRAAIGDTIVHPVAQQRYYINRTSCMAETCAWNTGFWAGIVLSPCLFLCGGAFYRRFYGLKQKNIMRH
jgi:hypothetical protein